MTTPPRPPLPRLSLADVAAVRRKIVEEVAYGYEEDLMAGPTLRAFAADLARSLAGRGVDPAVASASCAAIRGQVLTGRLLFEFAWRVAGNLPRLAAGRPLGPVRPPEGVAWIAVQVASQRPGRDRRGRLSAELDLVALAGPYCTGRLRKTWTLKQCAFAAALVGFSARWGVLPYQDPAQLVGLRFFGLADPDRARDGRPDVREVAAGSAMLDHNRTILKVRHRRGAACPHGYDGERFVACHRCGMGYAGSPSCPAATHRRAYEPVECVACGRDDVPCDPDLSADECVPCATARLTAQKE